MSRFIGGKYGAGNVPIDSQGGQTAPPAVYSSSDQFWMQTAQASNWFQHPVTLTSTSPTASTTTPGNGFTYMRFSGPGQVTIANSGTLDILVVAGGGGGGSYYGAGGGAGGVAYGVSIPFAEPPSGTVYPVEVGTGGAGAPGAPKVASSGNVSNFGNPGSPIGTQPDRIQTKGGGGGGAGTAEVGLAGGSGGGDGGGNSPPYGGLATQPGTNPSPLITDYGYPGGWCYPTGGYGPAGGGGAGAQGVNQTGNDQGGGDGGVGVQIPLFPYPLVGLSPLDPYSPTTNHYGGGGGAGKYGSWVAPDREGKGGYGGGGWGYPNPTTPMAGVDGLGGGGGGRHPGPGGGDGGDGVVIIRAAV